MTRHSLNIVDTYALTRLAPRQPSEPGEPSPGRWVRILRHYLRMTQAELARKAHMTQPHLAAIEADRVDSQVGTLRRVFAALKCGIIVRPVPEILLEEQLRARARREALRQVEKTFGPISTQNLGEEGKVFEKLLARRTEEIVHDWRVRLREND